MEIEIVVQPAKQDGRVRSRGTVTAGAGGDHIAEEQSDQVGNLNVQDIVGIAVLRVGISGPTQSDALQRRKDRQGRTHPAAQM